MKVTPFLWFDKDQALEAAKLYENVFNHREYQAKAEHLSDTPSGDVDIHTVDIFGIPFTLMGAGPEFVFNESVSFVIECENQEEIDYYWNSLTSNGGTEGQCGWLKDPFGLSWQVTTKKLNVLLTKDTSGSVMRTMLQMSKIVISELEHAYADNQLQ